MIRDLTTYLTQSAHGSQP